MTQSNSVPRTLLDLVHEVHNPHISGRIAVQRPAMPQREEVVRS